MKHYNPSITERANRIFNLKNGDQMPDEVEGPVAVIPLVAAPRIIRRTAASNSTSATIYTTPSDRDFYITAVVLSVAQDATATSTGHTIQATVDGVAQVLAEIATLSTTAAQDSIAFSFDHPVKIDRGTNINVTNTTNVATVRAVGVIHGYIEEVTRT